MRAALLISAIFLTVASAQSAPPAEEVTPQTSEAEPPALAAIRSRYAESIAAADRAVTGQWAVTLAALEKSRAVTGNYDGAEMVRLRREEALSVAGTDDGRLPVRLGFRELTNKGSGLTVTENSGTVMLRSAGAFLEWDISGDFKGWYEVQLTHAVDGGGDRTSEAAPVADPPPADRPSKRTGAGNVRQRVGGRVSFQNVSNLSRKEAALKREILSTGGWNAWRTVSLGKFEITGRIAKFRLTADEAGSEGLMHFKHLELIPSRPPAASGDGNGRLAKVREDFDREFRSQTQAAVATARYRDALNALENQALRDKDNDALARVREEKSRLAQSPEKLALGTPDDPLSESLALTLSIGDTFNCHYRGEIRHDSNRAILTGLRPAGAATVTWRLPAYHVGSGTYAVAVKGRVPVNGGGSATLAAFGPSNAAAGPVLELHVKPVVSPEARNKKPAEGVPAPAAENRTEKPGKIVIGKGAETLTLTVTRLTHNDGWLMDISSITLTRTDNLKPAKSLP